MPYKIVGSTVMHKKDDKWSKKQTASSHDKAVKAIRLLQAIEHNPNFKPRKA